MEKTNRFRFDEYLRDIRADDLKQMARTWGGDGKTRKEESVQAIIRGLSSQDKVRQVLLEARPVERTALALTKMVGNHIPLKTLILGVQAAGHEFPRPRSAYGDVGSEMISAIIQRGLLLSRHEYDLTHISQYENHPLFSDERLLAPLAGLGVKSFGLSPMPEPPTTRFRPVTTVMLDLMDLCRVIANLGGLDLTKNGAVRVGSMRKLARALHWGPDLVIDDLTFPDPATALIGVMILTGMLRPQEDKLVLFRSVADLAEARPQSLIAVFVWAFCALYGWDEPNYGYLYNSAMYAAGRMALLVGLAALPGTDGFFSFGDFEKALFARVGSQLTLSDPWGLRSQPRPTDKAQSGQGESRLRASWLERERPWLARMLGSWLYYLGLVELGFAGTQLVGLRLTALGRELLHPEWPAPADEAPALDTTPWVVQPNFDLVAYIAYVSPAQVGFLDRLAERTATERHVLHYRLSRESVYRGLESGLKVDDILKGLEAGSRAPLPQNVATEIRAWDALYGQVKLHPRARVLEYPNPRVRDHALASQAALGVPLRERYLLLSPDHHDFKGDIKSRIDYAEPLPPCLKATEAGVVTLDHLRRDLLIEGELGNWSTKIDDDTWQLSAEVVGAAIKAGGKMSEMLKFFNGRLLEPMPPLLEAMLRAWCKRGAAVKLEEVVVLRCGEAAAQAIASSTRFKRYIRGTLGPGVLLVDRDQADALRAELVKAGLLA